MSTARAVATDAAVRTHAPGAPEPPVAAGPTRKRDTPGIGRPAAAAAPAAPGTPDAAAAASAATTGSGSPATAAAGDLISATGVETRRTFGAIAAVTAVPSDRASPSGACRPAILSVLALRQRTRSAPPTRAGGRIGQRECPGPPGTARAARAPGRRVIAGAPGTSSGSGRSGVGR